MVLEDLKPAVGLAASCRTQPNISGMKLLQLIVLCLPQGSVLELWLENFGEQAGYFFQHDEESRKLGIGLTLGAL